MTKQGKTTNSTYCFSFIYTRKQGDTAEVASAPCFLFVGPMA